MIVSVTKKDIASGIRNSGTNCPIALSIKRRYPGKQIVVSSMFILGIDLNTIELPKRVTDWLVDYDNGKPVKPFRFAI